MVKTLCLRGQVRKTINRLLNPFNSQCNCFKSIFKTLNSHLIAQFNTNLRELAVIFLSSRFLSERERSTLALSPDLSLDIVREQRVSRDRERKQRERSGESIDSSGHRCHCRLVRERAETDRERSRESEKQKEIKRGESVGLAGWAESLGSFILFFYFGLGWTLGKFL